MSRVKIDDPILCLLRVLDPDTGEPSDHFVRLTVVRIEIGGFECTGEAVVTGAMFGWEGFSTRCLDSQEGIDWARGWDTPEANALRSAVALGGPLL